MCRKESIAVMLRRRFWIAICTLALGCPLVAQAESLKQPFTIQERWVLKQVAAGQRANLEKFGYKEEDRKLSASFLVALLTGKRKVKVQHKGIEISNAVMDEPLDLAQANIPHSIYLWDCLFKELVVCRDTVFEKHFMISRSNLKKGGNFHRIEVKRSLFCKGVIFEGPVDFAGANIGGNFEATRAKFRDENEEANFSSLRVGLNAVFDDVTFEGPVNFRHADIGGQFSAEGAKFRNEKEVADFNSMKVGNLAIFKNAVFHGKADFRGADIGAQLQAEKAKFLSEDKEATFRRMKVKDTAFFDDAIFMGPRTDFEEMQCHSALFPNVKIRGHFNLSSGNYMDVHLMDARAFDKAYLNLKRTQINRELKVSSLELNSLEASCLRVKGLATFENLDIVDSADFQNAALVNIEFNKINWPKEQGNLRLDGLTYTSLWVDGQNNFEKALEFLKNSAFNPWNYVQLEEYYKRAGHKDWSDTVYIAMKEKELENKSAYNPWKWIVKIFWGWLAGYGRAPFRVFWVSLAIVLGGAVLFDPKYLDKEANPASRSLLSDWEYEEEEKRPDRVSKLRLGMIRFLISLDQFLPAINMGIAEHWQAKDTKFSVWLYFTLEQCLGWILIPIALAAIYTQVK